MELGRRGFIKGVGVLGGAAATSGFGIDAIAQAAAGAKSTKKGAAPAKTLDIRKIKSGCAICPNFCGIEATVVNGVIRTIYPDAARAEFYNHGICPKGASGMYNTYDPYRLKKPLKRTNPNKGPNENPGWVEMSWDEAFTVVTARLAQIRAADPKGLVVQYGQGKYLIQEHFPRAFCDAFGSPNYVHRTTVCEAARHVADDATWGYHGHTPDLKHTNLLLNFGSNYHEGEQFSRWLDWQTVMSRERGMKVVVIDPRLSGCAAKADEWVAMRPGKDVAMILAMAKILIDANTIDEPFLLEYTNAPQLVGADGKIALDKDGKTPLVWDTVTNSAAPFAAGVKPALKGAYAVAGNPVRMAYTVLAESLKDMTPQYAEEVCGVPAATITRLALTFGKEARIGETKEIDGVKVRYRPVVAFSFRGLAAKEFGVQNCRSALILNMLVGAVEAAGGLALMGTVYNSPAYMETAKCEYPPTRVDLKYSVFHPNSHHDIAQQVNITALDPKSWGVAVCADDSNILWHQPSDVDIKRVAAVRGPEENVQRSHRCGDERVRVVCRYRAAGQDLSRVVALRPDARYAGSKPQRDPAADGQSLQPRAGCLYHLLPAGQAPRPAGQIPRRLQQALGAEGSDLQARPRLLRGGSGGSHLDRQDQEGLCLRQGTRVHRQEARG